MNSFIYTFYTLFCTRSTIALAGQQCCIVDDDDHHHRADDDDVAPLQLPFAPILALPCPAVCLGHKSKEQIAAAKAVKANKPKCRRNKLANVMDAATQGELELEQAGKQGVVFSWSCAMFLTLSSFSLSLCSC